MVAVVEDRVELAVVELAAVAVVELAVEHKVAEKPVAHTAQKLVEKFVQGLAGDRAAL